jgi:hypothetical protein
VTGFEGHHVVHADRLAQGVGHHHGVPVRIEVPPAGGGDHLQAPSLGRRSPRRWSSAASENGTARVRGFSPGGCSSRAGPTRRKCRLPAPLDDGHAVRGDRLVHRASQHQGVAVGDGHPARRHRRLHRAEIRGAGDLEPPGQEYPRTGGHRPRVGPGRACSSRGFPSARRRRSRSGRSRRRPSRSVRSRGFRGPPRRPRSRRGRCRVRCWPRDDEVVDPHPGAVGTASHGQQHGGRQNSADRPELRSRCAHVPNPFLRFRNPGRGSPPPMQVRGPAHGTSTAASPRPPPGTSI